MDLKQLSYFVAAVDHRHIGRAADSMGVSQPTLSRGIQRLESSLGVQLLEREPKGVSLTPFGQRLLNHARVMLNEAHRARSEVDALSDMTEGQINFGISPNFAQYLVPKVVAKLTKDKPGLNINVFTAFYDDLLVRVRNAELDLAFTLLPPFPQEPDMVFRELGEIQSSVHARASHPLATNGRASLKTLSGCRWVVHDNIAVDRRLGTIFSSAGLPIPRQVIRTDSVAFLHQTVLNCDLVAMLPEHLVEEDISAARICRIHNAKCVVRSTFGAILRRGVTQPPATEALMEGLRAALAI